MRNFHDWFDGPLGCIADQLVREAFQVQAVKASCIVGTVAEHHESEEHQYMYCKTCDCTGVSRVSQGIRDKLHISLFQLYRSAFRIFLHSQYYSPTCHFELVLQQTERMHGIPVYVHLSSSAAPGILWNSTILLCIHRIAFLNFLTHTKRTVAKVDHFASILLFFSLFPFHEDLLTWICALLGTP